METHMAALKFRNISADPTQPVETWPTEGVITALERGDVGDWARVSAAVRNDPWGPVARRLEDALATVQPYGVGLLMQRVLVKARQTAEVLERVEVARKVRKLVQESGLDRASFAQAIGTSASRLSTYATGKVVPSATLVVRMERLVERKKGELGTRSKRTGPVRTAAVGLTVDVTDVADVLELLDQIDAQKLDWHQDDHPK